jgi:hypothetical protein
MKSGKKLSSKVTPHTFTSGVIQRLADHQELQIARMEIIGLLDEYSASFADWSIIISEAIHDVISKKVGLNIDCEKERKMLDDLTFLFTRLSCHSGMLSEWHKQLSVGNELTAKMIEEGHP